MKANWRYATIGDISEVVTKGTTPTSVGYKFTDDGINFIKVETIDHNWGFNPNKFAHIDEDCHQSLRRSQLKTGDILFSIAGALGRVARVTGDVLPANTNQALSIIRLKKDDSILTDFVIYALTSEALSKQIEKNRGGVAQQNLSLAQVKNFSVPLPSLSEQKRIVAILDEAFSGIEKVVANTEKNIANIHEFFDSYLHSLYWNRSEKWGEKKLGDVCENLDSKRIPITKSKRKPGKIPYYGASGIVDYVEGHLFDEDLLLVSEDGANLLARTYPIAFSISGKSWVNNHAHVLRFEDFESQKFIEYFLNSISLAPFVSGMAQPKLNQKALNSIPVPFPDIKTQHEVVEKLDEMSDKTKKLCEIYEQKLTTLTELKQSLLQKAFSGELTAEPQALLKEAAA